MFRNRASIVGLAVTFLFAGCVERDLSRKDASFDESKLTSVCAVLLDMSASFRETLKQRGNKLFFEIVDRHLSASMGADSKLIVGQLSAEKDQIVLFEGSPADFRRRFRSPQEFTAFIASKSDPSASHVLEATRRTLDYLVSTSGITENTQLTLVVLSDMHDSESNAGKRAALDEELKVAMKDFQAKGGAMALYYVAEQQREKWYRRFRECGFTPEQYVVETDLAESPRLPKFE
jgi:hypothetical protein